MSLSDQKETIVENCAVFQSVQILGGRYKLLVLRALLYAGRALRFGVLRREVPGISQKTLTRALRELEASGLLTRTVYGEVPPRVEYDLTEAGKALMPIFTSMRDWRDAHPEIGSAGMRAAARLSGDHPPA
ncbi:MAG: helix-turn-helix domain-containing protein [Bauldia sp.]